MTDFTYYILEKKRPIKGQEWVEDPFYIERKILFSLQEAESAAAADTDSFRIYSAPATKVTGTEDFVSTHTSTHTIEI